MPLRLRDNLYWCECGGRAVFLDAAADRYFCLPTSMNDAFLQVVTGDVRVEHLRHLAALMKNRILISDPDAASTPLPAQVEEGTRDYLSEPYPRAGLIHIIGAFALELRTSFLLRTRPILQVIETARRRPPGRPRLAQSREASLDSIVVASSRVSLFTRAHDRCLVRAFAVHAACKRAGIEAKVVFGVIANPFAAHCWVQSGNAVLVGEYEQVRLYKPILAFE